MTCPQNPTDGQIGRAPGGVSHARQGGVRWRIDAAEGRPHRGGLNRWRHWIEENREEKG
jgi:hypothetical protein